MSRPRYLPDPELERLSKVIPDAALDEFFPSNYPGKRGRPFALFTSQYFRIHLLALVKGITSFNRLCAELRYNPGYRRFCKIKSIDKVPASKTLSDFRSQTGPEAFALINDLLLERLFSMIVLPEVAVAVPDSTDLEASCSGYGKKNVLALRDANASESTRPMAPPKATVPRSRASPPSSWDIKNIPFD